MSVARLTSPPAALPQYEFLVRITRVRRRHPKFTVVSSLVVDEEGRPVPRAPNYSVAIPAHLSPMPVCQGQRWRVTGIPEAFEFETPEGWLVQEMRFTAGTASLERTSGSHIVALLCNQQFPGVGRVTAQRAWDQLGERLYEALDKADYDALSAAVGHRHAYTLISGWAFYSSTELLRWMQTVDLDVNVGRKVLKVYGRLAFDKIRADPYRLLALGLSWSATDGIAMSHLGIVLDDPRRLAAAVEAELYSAFDNGDTFLHRAILSKALNKSLTPKLAEIAIDTALAANIVRASDGNIYAPGPYLLEKGVAEFVNNRLDHEPPLFGSSDVERLITEFQVEERLRSGVTSFELNAAQQQAVHLAATNAFFCLVGGAGVGKTTTLNAIVHLLDKAGRTVYLLAPTGKAAKRMRQATRREAMTIAGFLRNVVPSGVPSDCVVIVDESSMLDIHLAYQLVAGIPASARLILIGDPAQLPPVGPGLTLHVIADSGVPKVELTEGMRFAGRVAQLAADIRSGVWHSPSQDHDGEVCFIACDDEALPAKVVEVYLRDPTNSQVLCSTKTSGASPTQIINRLCQESLRSTARRLLVYSDDRQRLEDTGLREGDPVICTTNLWNLDLQNGSIGRLAQIVDPPEPLLNGDDEQVGKIYAWVEWDDGERRPLTEEVLDAIELAYAITVHKSQGSEVPVVVVPVYSTRNLDRTLLYTAITRAKRKVVMVGNAKAARDAVRAEPHASRRRTMLGAMLASAGGSSV